MTANGAEKPSEVERATSYSLLLAINLLPGNANRLAAQKRFLEIRQAVAHWWMNRFSVGGKFDDAPGIVVRWLDRNPVNAGIPAMDPRFLQDDFGRRWRTKAEIEAERLAQEQKDEEQRQLLAEIEEGERQREEQRQQAAPLPDDANLQELWQHALRQLEVSVPASTFNAWLKDTYALGWEEETLLVATPNIYTCNWLQERLRPMVKRLLTHITGQSVNIRFVVSSVPILRPEDT